MIDCTDARPDADALVARRMWALVEPVHDVVYFTPEPRRAATELGLKGYWMGYFAMRAAPLGAVGPAAVTAVFHGFHPSRAARALPDAWALVSPEEIIRARERACAAALRRLCGRALGEVQRAADLAWRAAARVDVAGRPLGAANAAVRRPEDPVAALWQACTTLREHRGDGHVAALVVHGVGAVDAHLLKAADTPGTDVALLRTSRRWSEQEWADAARELRGRGLLDDDGALTASGRAVRDAVELATDHAAAAPWRGFDAVEELAALLAPITEAVHRSGELPRGNPVGLDG